MKKNVTDILDIHTHKQEVDTQGKSIINYPLLADSPLSVSYTHLNKEKTGARIEVFLLRELNEELRLWDVLVDPARKIRIGNKLYFGPDDSMVAEVIDNTTSRGRTLRFLYDGPHDEFKKALYSPVSYTHL